MRKLYWVILIAGLIIIAIAVLAVPLFFLVNPTPISPSVSPSGPASTTAEGCTGFSGLPVSEASFIGSEAYEITFYNMTGMRLANAKITGTIGTLDRETIAIGVILPTEKKTVKFAANRDEFPRNWPYATYFFLEYTDADGVPVNARATCEGTLPEQS